MPAPGNYNRWIARNGLKSRIPESTFRERIEKGVKKEVRLNRSVKQSAARKRLKSIIPIDQYIPDEIIQEILYRLPPNSLIEWSCVSKIWFNTICRNHKFAVTHLLHSQKKNKMSLSFHLSQDLSNRRDLPIKGEFFYLGKDEIDLKRSFVYAAWKRPLASGYCNGLYCQPGLNYIRVCNPSRDETVTVLPPPVAEYDEKIEFIGFGFDSLSNRYKVVLVAHFIWGDDKCLVFTFGADSCWREVKINLNFTTSKCRIWTLDKSSVFCNGVLYWRGAREYNPLVVSFDLHNESFHLIPVPPECISADDKLQRLVHLLDYKGALCVVRLEKQSSTAVGVDISSQNYKLHLHTLRDRTKQVWIKETPVVLPFPLPLIDTTRVLGFADDQVLFHWFDGKDFQLRDMHMKYVKVVMPPAPHVEYSVNNHMENVLSLRTFLPTKARRLADVDQESCKKSLQQGRQGFGVFQLITHSVFKAELETYVVD